MSDEKDVDLDETDETLEEENDEQTETDELSDETEQESSGEEEGEIEEEFVVNIDGEEPLADEDEVSEEELKKAPTWTKNLRKKNRELEKKQKELEAKLASLTVKEAPKSVSVKPKLSDEGIDYDTDIYETKLADWIEQNRKVKEEETRKKEEQRKQQETWQKRQEFYSETKSKIPAKDFVETEDYVKVNLSVVQQGIIVKVADNPALLVYALGKNASALKKIAAINDPIDFAAAISKLETKLKTSTKRVPLTAPEKTITASTTKIGSIDSTLDKLRKEAEKTNDYSKVTAYKRSKRRAK